MIAAVILLGLALLASINKGNYRLALLLAVLIVLVAI